MMVHFVCSGNSFRSRLAESYFNSLNINGYKATSSGAHSYLDLYDRISTHADVVLKNEGLWKYASPDKNQISQEQLDKSDIVICMNKTVYKEAVDEGIHFPLRTYIWDIDDIKQFSAKQKQQLAKNEEPTAVKTIFNNICQHIDDLVNFLKSPRPTEQIDVLNQKGEKTGATSDIATIHENGWWHAGAHIGLYTTSGKVLLEHRSQRIMFNPGLWDISTGGIVTSGETQETTIIRELEEELGVKLSKSELKKLFVWRYDHYLPHYGHHNRNLTHTYIAKIPEHLPLSLQSDEVSEVSFLALKDVRIMNDKLDSSKLIRTRSYNNKILDAIEEELKFNQVS